MSRQGLVLAEAGLSEQTLSHCPATQNSAPAAGISGDLKVLVTTKPADKHTLTNPGTIRVTE